MIVLMVWSERGLAPTLPVSIPYRSGKVFVLNPFEGECYEVNITRQATNTKHQVQALQRPHIRVRVQVLQ